MRSRTYIAFHLLALTGYRQEAAAINIYLQALHQSLVSKERLVEIVGKLHAAQVDAVCRIHPVVGSIEVVVTTLCCQTRIGDSLTVLVLICCPGTEYHIAVLALTVNPVVGIVLDGISTKLTCQHGEEGEVLVLQGKIHTTGKLGAPATDNHTVLRVDNSITILVLVFQVTRLHSTERTLSLSIVNFFLTVVVA